VLLVDNRGIGNSDKPYWYSTSDMAIDLMEIMDHVGWTALRSVHVVGLSMGGMIAQELGCLDPGRIATLNLLHTAPRMELNWIEWFFLFVALLINRPFDVKLRESAFIMFDHAWVTAPDDAPVPQKGTPGVTMPRNPDGSEGEYPMFSSNYERYVAQEMSKQLDPTYGRAEKWAMIGQLVACTYHRKTDAQLVAMADRVGRERICCLQTTKDLMMNPAWGRRMMEIIQPGTALMQEASGHVPKLEKSRWFNKFLADSFDKGEALTKGETNGKEGL